MEELAIANQPFIAHIGDASRSHEVRRAALQAAEHLGWSEVASGKLAIVVAEIASNLLKHARAGEMHISLCERNELRGIEVLALDRGPGIRNVERCLRDGYSTAGTSGTGLGAILRLADEFDVFSEEGKGTVLVARLYPSEQQDGVNAKTSLTVGAVQVPIAGETECGDHWRWRAIRSGATILMADGLGHGPGASQASRAAVALLDRSAALEPVAILEQVHCSLKATRGAAVAVAQIDVQAGQIRYAGIGNISASIAGGGKVQHLVSHNGTAGHNARKLQQFVYGWNDESLLIMHSDGITTSWRLESYPGLLKHHPSLIAATLFRDASRGRDDACVLAARSPSTLKAQ